MVGKAISHYQILEKLGEGGMGVVYKARDTHLDRFVAIKVLPPEKVADSERKRRFVQEAKAASALNHPNIIVVHDIASDAGTDFIVMEYVPGKTLDELIPRKGMRLSEALKYSVEIADALAKAHSAGIIHRDLKPGNVMVGEDGRVRVLDFGLAKLTEAALLGDDEATRTMKPATEEGKVVGTVSYMSPEQAEGKKVDARSDIFSFGSVLYEIVTGRRAFQKESKASTLGAIIHKEPEPLGAEVPHDLQKLIGRCLRKDRAHRFQHMDDVKVALEELKEESDSGKLTAAQAPARPRKTWRWVHVAPGAVVLLVVTGWLIWQKPSAPLPPPRIVSLTDYAGSEGQAALSPDGSQVAFSWNGEKEDNYDIYVKPVGAVGTPLRRTTDPAADSWPTWSPDGSQIAFVRGQGTQRAIYLTPPLVGEARKLADLSPLGSFNGPSWSPDGKWLAVAEDYQNETSGIALIPVEGGTKRALISGPFIEGRYRFPTFSHDGHFLAYASISVFNFGDLYLLELGADLKPKREPRRLTHQAGLFLGIAWAPDGRSVIYGARFHVGSGLYYYLWRMRVEGATPPERLESAGRESFFPATPRKGYRLAYTLQQSQARVDIWRLEVGAPPKRFLSSNSVDIDPQFSPDGTKVAYESAGSGSESAIWVANRDGSNRVQLTEAVGGGRGSPSWSPDGKWIAYDGQSEDGHWDIFVVDAAGGQPRRLTTGASDEIAPSWSRDGKWIYFSSSRTGQTEIWRMPAGGEGKGEQLTDKRGNYPTVSGETLYYQKSAAVFARALAGGPERQILDSFAGARGFFPVEDGIYYFARLPKEGPNAFELRFLHFATGRIQSIATFESAGIQRLSVSPDRKTFLYSGTAPQSVSIDLMLVENFR